MLSFLVYLKTMQSAVFPAVFLFGTAPTMFSAFLLLRASTLLLPRKAFEKGDECVWSIYQRLILFFYENYVGTEITFYGDDIFQKKENVLYMSNHQCEVDWIVADMLAVRQGSLGRIRFVLKDGLRYFPLFGFYFKQHGCVYVQRSGKYNKCNASKQMEQLANRKTPLWMIVFPEGTRYNPLKKKCIEKSQQFAREHGLPVLQHVLTPRLKAFQLCLDQLCEHIDAIYDVTIAYGNTRSEGGTRNPAFGMVDYMLDDHPEIHIHVRRIGINEVDSSHLESWLHGRFQEKERLLDLFYAQGTFEGTSHKSKLSLTKTLPAILLFCGVNILLAKTEIGREIYWKTACYGSILGCAWMAIKY